MEKHPTKIEGGRLKKRLSSKAGDSGALMLVNTKQLEIIFHLSSQALQRRQHSDLIIGVLRQPVSICRTKERRSCIRQLKNIHLIRKNLLKNSGFNDQKVIILVDLARAILKWRLTAFELSFAVLEDLRRRMPAAEVSLSMEWQLAILRSTHYPKRALAYIEELERSETNGGPRGYQLDIDNLKQTLQHLMRLGANDHIYDFEMAEWKQIVSRIDCSETPIDFRIKSWLLSLFLSLTQQEDRIAKPSTLRRGDSRRDSDTYITDALISSALYAQKLQESGADDDEITIFEKVRSKIDSVPDLEFQLILCRAFIATAAARKLNTVRYLLETQLWPLAQF